MLQGLFQITVVLVAVVVVELELYGLEQQDSSHQQA
jgi:hypothetical protein